MYYSDSRYYLHSLAPGLVQKYDCESAMYQQPTTTRLQYVIHSLWLLDG